MSCGVTAYNYLHGQLGELSTGKRRIPLTVLLGIRDRPTHERNGMKQTANGCTRVAVVNSPRLNWPHCQWEGWTMLWASATVSIIGVVDRFSADPTITEI